MVRVSGPGKLNDHPSKSDIVRDKIKPIAELAAIAERARANGETVVLCHGVFDLVHLGHLRHLESAQRFGSVLIVTITADDFVLRGPGRPIFSDDMRAEMLASLEYVDYVGVQHGPTAEQVIEQVRPDIYVKGSDYLDPVNDVTGEIVKERAAVEKYGGRLEFTHEITFSSSSLINQNLNVFDPPLQDYLSRHRDDGTADALFGLIESVADYRVLLIGDAILDEYRYATPMGKPQKENLIAARFKEQDLFAGGVFAAANHIASFCKEVEVITCLGTGDSRERFIRDNLKPNVTLTPLYREGAPTTRKSRYIDPSYLQKLFEVYFIDDSPLPAHVEDQLKALIAERAGGFDLVVAADFGHGLLRGDAIAMMAEQSRFLAVNTQTNSANYGYNLITRYPKADYVCIDAPEARLAAADRYGEIDAIVADELPRLVDCGRFIVTHGHFGCITTGEDGEVVHIPAFTRTVVDTIGAGDAFFSVTAPLAAAGGRMEHIAFVGNAAGAIKVSIVGHRRSVEKVQLMKYITTLLK